MTSRSSIPLLSVRFASVMLMGSHSFRRVACDKDQPAVLPPSTWRTWPVMKEASSDAMKTIALASSSERPSGPIGTVTLAPLLAKATAAARPMAVSPPVIKTTGVLMVQSFQVLPSTDAAADGGDLGGSGVCRKDFVG